MVGEATGCGHSQSDDEANITDFPLNARSSREDR